MAREKRSSTKRSPTTIEPQCDRSRSSAGRGSTESPKSATDPSDPTDPTDRSDQTRRPAWPDGPRTAQAILRPHLEVRDASLYNHTPRTGKPIPRSTSVNTRWTVRPERCRIERWFPRFDHRCRAAACRHPQGSSRRCSILTPSQWCEAAALAVLSFCLMSAVFAPATLAARGRRRPDRPARRPEIQRLRSHRGSHATPRTPPGRS